MAGLQIQFGLQCECDCFTFINGGDVERSFVMGHYDEGKAPLYGTRQAKASGVIGVFAQDLDAARHEVGVGFSPVCHPLIAQGLSDTHEARCLPHGSILTQAVRAKRIP
jgi:hypothetical protein